MSLFRTLNSMFSVKSLPEILPSAYQKVEYIQSSGTQYIDTNVKCTNTTDFEIEYYVYYITEYATAIGVDDGNTSRLFLGVIDNKRIKYNYFYLGDKVVSFNNPYANTNIKTKASYNHNNFTLKISNTNGTITKTLSNAIVTPSQHTISLFVLNREGEITDNTRMRLYSCKIINNGKLVRQFVPCYRKSDGVIGLYDLVSNSLFTNSGTGVFTKGSNV